MADRAIDHPLMPKRRWFLKTALAIGVVGTSLGGLVFWHRGLSEGKLTQHGRDVLHGLARGVLGPQLPSDAAEREAVLTRHVDNLESFIRGTPAVLQIQVNAILGLLGNPPTRYMLTDLKGSWREASDAQIDRALENMRLNPLPTQRLTYQVVRGLTCMTFFSDSANWPLTGYPGPLDI